MLTTTTLPSITLSISYREKREGLFKILVPFFHEDGDMYDIFLQESPVASRKLRICDKGLTLMKLSYTFDIDTPKKESILHNIIHQNHCDITDGEVYLDCTVEQFEYAIYQYAQTISKIMNTEILTRETIRSMFTDNLRQNLYEASSRLNVKLSENVSPLSDASLRADYSLENHGKIIYLFGINSDTKASKAIISCLQFQKARIPHNSLAIHENFENLSAFNRTQITNAVDKQFTSLSVFKEEQNQYFDRIFQTAQ